MSSKDPTPLSEQSMKAIMSTLRGRNPKKELSSEQLSVLPADVLVKMIEELNKPKEYVLLEYDGEFWLERKDYQAQIHCTVKARSKTEAYELLAKDDLFVNTMRESDCLIADILALCGVVEDLDSFNRATEEIIDELKEKLKTGKDIENVCDKFCGCTRLEVFKASGSLWNVNATMNSAFVLILVVVIVAIVLVAVNQSPSNVSLGDSKPWNGGHLCVTDSDCKSGWCEPGLPTEALNAEDRVAANSTQTPNYTGICATHIGQSCAASDTFCGSPQGNGADQGWCGYPTNSTSTGPICCPSGDGVFSLCEAKWFCTNTLQSGQQCRLNKQCVSGQCNGNDGCKLGNCA